MRTLPIFVRVLVLNDPAARARWYGSRRRWRARRRRRWRLKEASLLWASDRWHAAIGLGRRLLESIAPGTAEATPQCVDPRGGTAAANPLSHISGGAAGRAGGAGGAG